MNDETENTVVKKRILRLLPVSVLFLLSACATYHPLPLPKQSPLTTNLDAIKVRAAKLHSGKNSSHIINPGDGLDLTEVAVIAVLANPELRAERARLGVVSAQAFAAGLLPDPQLASSLDHPAAGNPGLVNAWSMGLSYDLNSLINHQARLDAEQGAQTQVKLEVLWQEWQVIQQAQTLAIRYKLEEQRLALLKNMRSLYQDRFKHSAHGLAEGNVTLDSHGADLTALLDNLSQISQLEQTHVKTRHDLSLLLGLKADARFVINDLPVGSVLAPPVIQQQLRRLQYDRARPLLAGVDRHQRLKAMAEQRNPLYGEIAELTITGHNERTQRAFTRCRTRIDDHWQRLGVAAS